MTLMFTLALFQCITQNFFIHGGGYFCVNILAGIGSICIQEFLLALLKKLSIFCNLKLTKDMVLKGATEVDAVILAEKVLTSSGLLN